MCKSPSPMLWGGGFRGWGAAQQPAHSIRILFLICIYAVKTIKGLSEHYRTDTLLLFTYYSLEQTNVRY